MSIRESMSRSLRERELAGDLRAGGFAPDKAWRIQREFIRDRWRWLGAAWMLMLTPATPVWWFVPPFVQGAVVAVVLTGATLLLWSQVVQVTGTAPTMMGDHAEQWTAQELRRTRRSGWRLVNRLVLTKGGDVDHVLIGSREIFVLETKWSATSWLEPFMRERLASARAQVARNARLVGAWQPVKASGLPVRPVVVLWGGGLRRTGVERLVSDLGEGVEVVAGYELRDWLRDRAGALGSGGTVTDKDDAVRAVLWERVDQHVRSRDAHELVLTRPVSTMGQWLARLAWFVAATSTAFVATAESVVWGPGWGIAAGLVLTALAVTGLRRLRRPTLRAATAGILLGAALPTVVLVVAVLLDLAL